MDERTVGFIEDFKRRGALMIFIPAVLVALLVAFGVGGMLIRSYGYLTATGLNALASGSLSHGGVDTPEGVAELKSDFDALLNQGAFVHIAVVRRDGTEILHAGEETWSPKRLEESGEEALREGKTSSAITRPKGKFLLHVVAPLTAGPGQEPYAVVHADRPFALITWSFGGAIVGFVLVVMVGATAAYLMIRSMVTEAERELERQDALLGVLNSRLAGSLEDIERQTLGTLQALSAAVDARDSYTAQHSLNVADYAVAIGRQMKLSADELLLIEQAGLLHDIGKIGVHESTLMKPGRLTPEEYTEIKEHPAIGAGIIEMIPFLEPIVDIVLYHHERWDGSGYPKGLAGEEVPLLARILAVADAFDAMTTDRPYRNGLPLSKARRELLLGSGTQFDPKAVDALLTALDTRAVVPTTELAVKSA